MPWLVHLTGIRILWVWFYHPHLQKGGDFPKVTKVCHWCLCSLFHPEVSSVSNEGKGSSAISKTVWSGISLENDSHKRFKVGCRDQGIPRGRGRREKGQELGRPAPPSAASHFSCLQWSHINFHFTNGSSAETKQYKMSLKTSDLCQILKFMEVVTEVWGASSNHSTNPYFFLTCYSVSRGGE